MKFSIVESQEITIHQALVYELSASWWASYIGIVWMQDLVSSYYAWKVKRKYQRYSSMLEMLRRHKKK